MRQSQCDRHKVKMMDVFGPKLPVNINLCCVAASPEADVRPTLQQSVGHDGSDAGHFGQSHANLALAFAQHDLPRDQAQLHDP